MKHVTSYIFLIIAFLLFGVNGAAAQKDDCPFTVTDKIDANISYDKENKVLSIEGSGNVTIEGDGTSTGWGIEIEPQSIHFQVTIKDLSIEREGVPLKIKGAFNCSIIIEGTNRFVSIGSLGTAGIEVEGPLSLRGSGSLTAIGAKGDDITPGGAGIGGGAYLNIYGGIIHAKGGVGAAGISGGGGYLTIDGGIIRAEGGAGAPGIGVSDPQEGMTIQIFGGTVTAIGSGGKNPAPGIYGGTSSNSTTIAGNAFVIAIDREDANEVIATTTQIENHTKGLFIRGEQDSDGSIVWASSDLKGDITLESDAEIPDWAEVTIADGQTFTIPDGITLTNNGTLTNKGTLTNNGTFSGTGTVESNTSLNIGGKDGFDVINTDGGATFSYNGTEKLLTISGSDRVLIKGRNKDKAVGCGIVIAQGASPTLTIEDLNIEAAEALVYKGLTTGLKIDYSLTLQGTNRLTSTSGAGINLNGNNITFAGSGSLTVTGGNGCAGIEAYSLLFNTDNVFVVAIRGKGAESGISGSLQHDSGFLIYGSQDDTGNFSQEYSKLIGSDFTLGGDAEIPKGATVTIAAGQTFTIAPGVTLTNNGTLENNGALTNEGTLTNNGTLSGTGIVESNTSLNIGGNEGFDVIKTDGDATFSYNGKEKLLTISGTIGNVLIKGRNKDNAVGCGIVIAQYASFYLAIEDLNIVTDEALVFRGTEGRLANYNLTLQGTNRLTSTSGGGINLNGNNITFAGSGSLTVTGGNGCAGIQGLESLSIYKNAFVVVIDGKDAASGISGNLHHDSGFLIYGSQDDTGNFSQEYSELKGDNFTLGGDAEIPAWAKVTIAEGQTFTIDAGVTLTNNGIIDNNGTLTNKGTLTNNGTLSGTGTVESNTSLNIGGEDGFDVFNTDGSATFSYDGTKEVLTISGSGYVLIRGRNKDKAVGCGIVIEQSANIRLTLEDLNIEAAEALVYKGRSDGASMAYLFTLQGTNRLTSTGGPGINIYNTNDITFVGTGSLTVTGGSGCAGIEARSFWLYQNSNVFVVAIGGKDAASGISGNFNHHSGLLIHGSQNGGGNFSQKYSKLVGSDFTLGGDAEIPDGAEVTIAKDQTFTIDAGVTLTNSGTINNEGIIYNKGTLTGNPVGGKLYHYITFDANYPASPAVDERYILQGDALPTDIFTRSGYTFQGWYDAPSGETKVETSAEPQTLYARWEAVPVPEPEPTVYYTVTLPFVEGAVTDPVAGDYDVESGSTFRFYLTLDTAYSQSQPVVTTSRGETLQPRTSDGAYLVKYVRTDVEIFIDGIEKNNPVANEPIRAAAPEPEIWSEDACLCIRLSEGLPTSPVRIFTPEGRLLDSFRSTPGLNRRQLPTGIYIVRVGATVRKVAIR